MGVKKTTSCSTSIARLPFSGTGNPSVFTDVIGHRPGIDTRILYLLEKIKDQADYQGEDRGEDQRSWRSNTEERNPNFPGTTDRILRPATSPERLPEAI